MQCPHCHYNDSRVVDSRPTNGGSIIRRRRECMSCGYRFTTFERVEQAPLLVIKRNGTREEFKREKVLNGIIHAAEKRPISMDQISKIVENVENKVRSLGENEVSSYLIGKYVLDYLLDIDKIAYIRFASVYRQFKDADEFMRELQIMMKYHDNDDK